MNPIIKYSNKNEFYFKQKARELSHRYGEKWYQKFRQSKLGLELKVFLINLNQQQHNGTLICDYCKEEITLFNDLYKYAYIFHAYDFPTPNEIALTKLNWVLHETCYKKIKYEIENYERGKNK